MYVYIYIYIHIIYLYIYIYMYVIYVYIVCYVILYFGMTSPKCLLCSMFDHGPSWLKHWHVALFILAIFYPFSQFCEIIIFLLSLQKQPKASPNLFQRGVEYGKYVVSINNTWAWVWVWSLVLTHDCRTLRRQVYIYISLSLYIYIYICVCMCVYICIYMYTCIHIYIYIYMESASINMHAKQLSIDSIHWLLSCISLLYMQS